MRDTRPNDSALTKLRSNNRAMLTEILRQHGPQTQTELTVLSKLSKATVSNLVRELVKEGVARTEPTTYNGRRAQLVSLRDVKTVVFGVDLAPDRCLISLVGVDRNVLATQTLETVPDWTPATFASGLIRVMKNMLADSGRTNGDVMAVGAGIPAPIESGTREIVPSPMLPSWVSQEAARQIEDELDTCVLTSNDANLCALAEVTWGTHQGVADLVYILVSEGIGAGFVLRGDAYDGSQGLAGEIGHVRGGSSQVLCRCGNRGCLESEISIPAIVSRVRELGKPVESATDVLQAIDQEDVAVKRVVEHAGEALGRTLGDLTNLLNPQVIVVGGSDLATSDAFVDAARAELLRWTLPIVTHRIELQADSLAGHAVALGAAEMAIRTTSV